MLHRSGQKTWLDRHGLDYALLRLRADIRPGWARRLGLRGYQLNGEPAADVPPRLRFKRRLGSHVAHPCAAPDFARPEEARYDSHLRALLDQHAGEGRERRDTLAW